MHTKPRTMADLIGPGPRQEDQPAAATEGSPAAGLFPIPTYVEQFPPTYPRGPRVVLSRMIKNKKVQWHASVYIGDVKHVLFRHPNPFLAMTGAMRMFVEDVSPKLPDDQQVQFAEGRTKIAALEAAQQKERRR